MSYADILIDEGSHSSPLVAKALLREYGIFLKGAPNMLAAYKKDVAHLKPSQMIQAAKDLLREEANAH